jgi:hypothetical protein
VGRLREALAEEESFLLEETSALMAALMDQQGGSKPIEVKHHSQNWHIWVRRWMVGRIA